MNGLVDLLRETGYALVSIGKGMGVTLVNLFRPKQTVSYPYQELVVPPNYRGALNFKEDLCIVCELCEKACPVPGTVTPKTIEIIWHIGQSKKRELDEFYIDYGSCINCYLCVDACPVDALVPGASYEIARIDPLAQYDRSRMIFGKRQLGVMPESSEVGSYEHAYEHVPLKRDLQPLLDEEPVADEESAPAAQAARTPAATT
ncbi:MAG: NADH-quinone oxidoreductase subunit I [Armatimonadetes bacterium]|nr:NADH-quinone oxidoreductase subunit I [Armatimonadota bacterium]